MENLTLYNQFRNPPEEAKKPIPAGRLKGMTDINPMWRMKALTEQFGPCGIGWKYVMTRQWLENGANGEIAAFVNIDLFVKYDGQWSEAIPGTGGSSFVANERNGPYTSDECYKMALTDALGIACKALGMAADVYWQKDRTKYDQPHETAQKPEYTCSSCHAPIVPYFDGKDMIPVASLAKRSKERYNKVLCIKCGKEQLKAEAAFENAVDTIDKEVQNETDSR